MNLRFGNLARRAKGTIRETAGRRGPRRGLRPSGNASRDALSSFEPLEIRRLLAATLPVINQDFAAGAADFTAVDGTWAASNGAYRVTTPGSAATTHLNTRAVDSTPVVGDFTLTADASVAGTANAWSDFAILFGYQNSSNYYFFSSNQYNDAATNGIFRVAGGVSTQLADIPTTITAGTQYQVRVEKAGDQIRAYRNNALLATATAPTSTDGLVGFGSKSDAPVFDNLIVTAPTPLPASPSALTAAAVSDTQIQLAWVDNSSDELGFKVERSTNGSTWTEAASLAAGATTYSATGLSPSTPYQFRVLSYNLAGNSGYSNVASATTQPTPIAPAIAESFDTGVAPNFGVVDGTWAVVSGAYRATTAGTANTTHLNTRSVYATPLAGDFTLTASASAVNTSGAWNDFGVIFGYQNADNYYFFSSNESNDANTNGIFKVVNGVSTELADASTTITAGTTYQVRVERSGDRINAYRNGALVAAASDLTFASGRVGFGSKGDQVVFDNLSVTGTASAPPSSAPAAPSALNATAASTTAINLLWTDNSSDETGFKVERSTDGINFTQIASLASGTTAYSALGLTASTKYFFRVRASNAAGDSGYSNVASATTAAAPVSGARPDSTNTGPTDASVLKSSGSITVTTDGAVIENVSVKGTIYIQANNVTIRNFRIDATGQTYGISAGFGFRGNVFEDGEIANAAGDGVYGEGYTARRLNVHHSGGDGFKHQGNGAIENCWVHDLGTEAGAHADGVQIMSGSGIVIRGNNFDMPIDQPGTNSNSAVFIRTAFGPIDNITVDGNWVNGGNYTIYSVGYNGVIPTNVRITNNRFGRDYRYGPLDLEGSVLTSANVWDDTGAPL